MNSTQIAELLNIIWPLLVLQFGFQIYAIYDLVKEKSGKTKNLTPIVWGIIIILGEILGAALYFLVGRSEE